MKRCFYVIMIVLTMPIGYLLFYGAFCMLYDQYVNYVVTNEISSIRLIDTHEHLEKEDELLKSSKGRDFTRLFTPYQMADMISAGKVMEKYDSLTPLYVHSEWEKCALEMNDIYDSTLTVEEKWEQIAPFWENTKHTCYGRAVLISANDLYNISILDEESCIVLSERIAHAHRKGYYNYVLKDKAGIDLSLLVDMPFSEENPPEYNMFFRSIINFDEFTLVHSYMELRHVYMKYKHSELVSFSDYLLLLKSVF